MKEALQKPPVLIAPDCKCPLKVHTDASHIGLEAVLTQEAEEGERVVAYASQLLAVTDHAATNKSCQD